MTQTISRTYRSPADAEAAVDELKRTGFSERAIGTVPPAPHAAEDSILQSITGAGVAPSHAKVYADALRHGETLVSIRAPFGFAALATSVLEKFHPTETGLGEQGYEKAPPDPAAPFSSACGWPVLSDNPAPLSSALGWHVLSERQSKRVSDAGLVHSPAPFSRMLGLKLLIDKAAPLSSRIGFKLLWDNAAPLSRRLGLRVLSGEQTMPEKRFGLQLLSNDPAPLSSRLGLKLLSDNPAPFSSWLGWRILSSK